MVKLVFKDPLEFFETAIVRGPIAHIQVVGAKVKLHAE
jgi:hypothetical protein